MDPSVDPERHSELSRLLDVHDKFCQPTNDYINCMEISEIKEMQNHSISSELQRYVLDLYVLVMPHELCADLSSRINTAKDEACQWLPLAEEQLTRGDGSSRQSK